jgi:hypothetical protein
LAEHPNALRANRRQVGQMTGNHSLSECNDNFFFDKLGLLQQFLPKTGI